MTSPHEQALAAAASAIKTELHHSDNFVAAADQAITAYLAALPAPDLSEWEKAAEGVTPGPWTLKVEGDDYIVSAPTDACLMSDEPYYPTAPCRKDAIWFTRCSPDNVLSALRSLSARLAEAERELDFVNTGAHAWIDRAEAAEARVKALTERLTELEADKSLILGAMSFAIERGVEADTFIRCWMDGSADIDEEWRDWQEFKASLVLQGKVAAQPVARASSLAAELADIKKEAGR